MESMRWAPGAASSGRRRLCGIAAAGRDRPGESAASERNLAGRAGARFTLALSLVLRDVFRLDSGAEIRRPANFARLCEARDDGQPSRERHRVRGVLVVAQVAMALVLLSAPC